MKVILLQDVAKIGKRFSVVNVPDGYATNQLIPKKLAIPATPENLKRTLHCNATVAATKEAGEARFNAAVAALTDNVVLVSADANEQDHLFQAVHESDIVAAAIVAGVDIDAHMIKIETPIKSLGKHEVGLMSGKKYHVFTIEVIKK
jgi:large subunit ribosomal protein L9